MSFFDTRWAIRIRSTQPPELQAFPNFCQSIRLERCYRFQGSASSKA
jgi:hypothetical protein